MLCWAGGGGYHSGVENVRYKVPDTDASVEAIYLKRNNNVKKKNGPPRSSRRDITGRTGTPLRGRLLAVSPLPRVVLIMRVDRVEIGGGRSSGPTGTGGAITKYVSEGNGRKVHETTGAGSFPSKIAEPRGRFVSDIKMVYGYARPVLFAVRNSRVVAPILNFEPTFDRRFGGLG